MSSQKDTTLNIPLAKVEEIIDHLKAASQILKGEEGATQDRPPPVRAPSRKRKH